jgi:hypothetical protein
MINREMVPGECAPEAGIYDLFDVLGSMTGLRVSVAHEEPLPNAPLGFFWMLAGDQEIGQETNGAS